MGWQLRNGPTGALQARPLCRYVCGRSSTDISIAGRLFQGLYPPIEFAGLNRADKQLDRFRHRLRLPKRQLPLCNGSSNCSHRSNGIFGHLERGEGELDGPFWKRGGTIRSRQSRSATLSPPERRLDRLLSERFRLAVEESFSRKARRDAVPIPFLALLGRRASFVREG